MTRIRAVLFDMFDTLMMIEKNHEFYSPSLKATYDFLEANGVEANFEEFEKAYVKAKDELYAKTEEDLREPHFALRISNALKLLGHECCNSEALISGATNAFCKRFMTYVKADEHAENALLNLHGKYMLGIVSNFAIPECVIKLLEKHNMLRLFDVVIVSGAVNRRKPHREIFHRALEVLGTAADETVFVGDTMDADVQGAISAGMRAVYIERRPQKKLESASPNLTIKSLKEIVSALETLEK